jgi:ZIP family zinc transporter
MPVSVLAGGVLATRVKLSRRTRSLVQHAAAGTVLAGLVVDVLAKLLLRIGQLAATAAGMVVGRAGMLAIRVLAGGQGEGGQSSLVVTILTDVFVDGVLIGLSAALGYRTGLLFAIAVAQELALLGVTAADALIDRWPAGRLTAPPPASAGESPLPAR